MFPTNVHSSIARNTQLAVISSFNDTVYDTVRTTIYRDIRSDAMRPAVAACSRPPRVLRKWSDEDVLVLSYTFGDSRFDAALAAELGRSIGAIRKKASRLGLGRPAPRQLELPTPPSLPAIAVRRTKTGRTVWDNPLVSAVSQFWLRGFDHHCIGKLIGSSAASVRSIANRRGMPDRGGYTLLHDYNPKAEPLPGLTDRMCEVQCKKLGVVFYVRKSDKAGSLFCPAFKKSKTYRDLSN